jgi:hypothetical protein
VVKHLANDWLAGEGIGRSCDCAASTAAVYVVKHCVTVGIFVPKDVCV